MIAPMAIASVQRSTKIREMTVTAGAAKTNPKTPLEETALTIFLNPSNPSPGPQKHELDQPHLRKEFQNSMKRTWRRTSPGAQDDGCAQEIEQGGAEENSDHQLKGDRWESKSLTQEGS